MVRGSSQIFFRVLLFAGGDAVLFGKKVDLVSKKALKPFMGQAAIKTGSVCIKRIHWINVAYYERSIS